MALVSLPGGEVTELTARLPSAIAYLVFLGAFFAFVARLASISLAVSASLILITMSEWFRSATTCRVDVLLATSMAGALLCLYCWWERGCRGIPWLAVGLTACATLTKGPVGVVLPLGIFSLFCWSRDRFGVRELPRIAVRAIGVALPVIAIASVWYVLGYLERGDAFIEKIRYENFDRFTSTMEDKPHNHSVFYLFGMLALGVLPWTLCWIVEGITRVVSHGRGPVLTGRSIVADVKKMWARLPSMYQFSFIAAATVVVFFCIPSSKRSVYLLPAYPFIAVMMAHWFQTGTQATARSAVALTRVVQYTTVLLLAVAAVLLVTTVKGVGLRWEAFQSSLSAVKMLASTALILVLFGPLRSVLREWYSRPIERLGLSLIAAVFMVSFCVYDPIAWQLSPKSWVSLKDFQERVSAARYAAPYYSYGSEMYGASFYLKKPFERVGQGSVARDIVVMLEAKRLEQFRREIAPNATELFRYKTGLEDERRDIVVVAVEVGRAS
jgi:4-amino-4-deoxy-L-arabinose transferase-like glycosyltransferase